MHDPRRGGADADERAPVFQPGVGDREERTVPSAARGGEVTVRLQTMLKRIAWILLGCIGGSVLGGLAGVGWYNWNHPAPVETLRRLALRSRRCSSDVY